MLNFADNPIYQRLTSHHRTPDSEWKFKISALFISVGLVGISMVLAATDHLIGNYEFITAIAAPIALILLLLMATVGTLLTVRSSQGEAFQLLHLTDYPSQQVIWGYVSATLYRTRFYGWLFIWIFPLSLLPIFMEVYDYANRINNDSSALLTTAPRANAMQAELIVFWVIGVLSAAGMSLLTVSGAVHAALKRRAVVRSILTALVHTIILILIGTFLLVITISATHNVSYIVFAALLAAIPYIVGLLFCRWKQTHPIVLITNSVYVPVVIFLIILIPLLSTPNDREALSEQWVAASAFLGGMLLLDFVLSWRRTKGPAGIILIAWFVVLTIVGRVVLTSNAIREDGVIFLWLIVFSLIISLFGFAFLNVERATTFLWNPKYYF